MLKSAPLQGRDSPVGENKMIIIIIRILQQTDLVVGIFQ